MQLDINEAKAIAIQFIRDAFREWHGMTPTPRNIGALIYRPAGDLLRKNRGWVTFADGLRQKLDSLPSRELNVLVKWLETQPLSALA
jgi:hypothetical protein